MTPKDKVFQLLAHLGKQKLEPMVAALSPDEKIVLARILNIDCNASSKSKLAAEDIALQQHFSELPLPIFTRLMFLTSNTPEGETLRPAALLSLRKLLANNPAQS